MVYLNVKIEAPPSKEPIKFILNQCKILFETIQEVNNKVIIAIYKEVENQEGITSEIKKHSSITKLRKYFNRIYPNSKGGKFNLKSRFPLMDS